MGRGSPLYGLFHDQLDLVQGQVLHFPTPEPNRQRIPVLLFLAVHYDHVDPFSLGISDLPSNAVVPVVHIHPSVQRFGQLGAVLDELLTYWYESYLSGRQPKRKFWFLLLQSLFQYRVDPSLYRAYRRMVDDTPFRLSFLIVICDAVPLRVLHIQLYCSQLAVTTYRVDCLQLVLDNPVVLRFGERLD